jgi:hypothetical protein
MSVAMIIMIEPEKIDKSHYNDKDDGATARKPRN